MIERYKPLYIKIFLYLIGAVIIAGLLFISYRFLIISLPFVIAVLFSSALEPLIRFVMLRSKGKLQRAPIAFVITLFFLTSTGYLITKLALTILRELTIIYKSASEYYKIIYESLTAVIVKLKDIYELLPPEITDNTSSLLQTFSLKAGRFLEDLIQSIFATAGHLPSIVFFVIVTILATFFIVLDRDKLSVSLRGILSEKTFERLNVIRIDVFSALGSYLKAMGIILTVTFLQLSIGFNIIGVKSAFVLALIISVFDILPVFGTGSFLVPWIAYELLTGNIKMGVSLIFLYAIVWVVRQIIEPKIVSGQIGIPPIYTLFSMYMGYRIIGFSGMLIGPILALVIKTFLSSLKKLKIDLGKLEG